MAKRKQKRAKVQRIIVPRVPWPEAEIVAEPVRESELTEPRLIVKRRQSGHILDPRGAEIHAFPGEPCISLFTGCGGIDLGLEGAGFCTVVQHERDRAACETLLANRPNCFRHAALIQGDIYQTPTHMLLEAGGLRVGEATMVTGGPPCQGFSVCNTKTWKTGSDERNDLVFEFLRVVREAQPSYFLMENVPGFVGYNKNAYLAAFLSHAYSAYYELVYGLVNAVEHGVPQDRCRFFCMGTRRDLALIDGKIAALPKPTTFGAGDLAKISELTVAENWAGLELLTHAPGIRYFPDRPVLVPPRPTNRLESLGPIGRSKKFMEFYAKLQREEPDRIVEPPPPKDDIGWYDRHVTVWDAIGDLQHIPLTDSGIVTEDDIRRAGLEPARRA